MSDTSRPTPDPVQPSASPDGYLWDRSAPVDAEVAALERALEPLRLRAGFAGVQQVTAARRMVVVRRWSMAVAAVVVIGVGLGWRLWPSTPQIRSVGPWRLVSTGDATVERVARSWAGVEPPVRVQAKNSPVELQTLAGSRAIVGAGSAVTIRDTDGAVVRERNGPTLSIAQLRLACAVAEQSDFVVDQNVFCLPGSEVAFDADGIHVQSGEARIGRSIDKGMNQYFERLFAGMSSGKFASVPLHDDAPDALASACRELAGAEWQKAPAIVRTNAVRSAIAWSREKDAPTLWNLAFAVHPTLSQGDREALISRLGQLLGRWPAAIKASKEPPWSPAFAEDWWTLIKESTAGDSKLGKEDDEAMKKKAEEAKKVEAEKAAKEKDELDKKAAPRGKESAPPSRGKGGK